MVMDQQQQMNMADFLQLLQGADQRDREQIAAILGPTIRAENRSASLRDAKQYVNTRYLINGAEVTHDSGGNVVGLTGGKGQFDIVNFTNGSATINSASNARQIDITAAGGLGAECPDIIVDADYTGTNGTAETNFFGDTVYLYSSLQQGIDRAHTVPIPNDGFGRSVNVHVCHGYYAENLSLSSIQSSHPVNVVALRPAAAVDTNNILFPSVQVGTGALPGLTLNGTTDGGAGIRFEGFDFLSGTAPDGNAASVHFNNNSTATPYARFEACKTVNIDINGDMLGASFENCRITGSIFDGASAGNVILQFRNTSVAGDISFTGHGTATSKYGVIDIAANSTVNGQIMLKRPTGFALNRWSLRSLHSKLNGGADSNTIENVVWVRSEGEYSQTLQPNVHLDGNWFGGAQAVSGHWDMIVLESTNGRMAGVQIVNNRVLYNAGNAGLTIHPVSVQGAGAVEGAVITGNNWGDENRVNTLSGVVCESSGTINNSVIADNAPTSFTDTLNGSGNSTPSSGGGASTADAFVTIGHPSDLPNSRAITAGTGITVTDGGINGPVTIASTVVTNLKQTYISFGSLVTGYSV